MNAPTMSKSSNREDQIPTLLMLLVTLAALHWLGRSTLAAPSVATLTRRADLSAWITQEGPVTVGLVGVRVMALAVGYHLLATLVVESMARAAGMHRLARRLQNLGLPGVRSVLGAAAGFAVGLAASGPAAAATPSTTVTLSHLPSDGTDSDLTASPIRTSADTATITHLGPSNSDSDSDSDPDSDPDSDSHSGRGPTTPVESTATVTMIGPVALEPAESQTSSASTDTGPTAVAPIPSGENSNPGDPVTSDLGSNALGSTGRTHIVVPGDHLWALAEAEVSASPGPDTITVDAYWRRVVLANPQLPNPDLLFAGQEITLPPLPH